MSLLKQNYKHTPLKKAFLSLALFSTLGVAIYLKPYTKEVNQFIENVNEMSFPEVIKRYLGEDGAYRDTPINSNQKNLT